MVGAARLTTFLRNVRRSHVAWGLALSVLAFVGLVWSHDVDMTVTEQDERYIEKYLEPVSIPHGSSSSWTYEDQVRVIAAVQDRVLTHNPVGRGIPLGQPRDPADLFQFEKGGLCYDRSNVLEKIFLHLGFEIRHVSIYFSGDLLALAKPGVPSHAVSEVLTKKGWLLVDSNYRWISRDEQGEPLSATQMKGRKSGYLETLPRSFAPYDEMQVIYGLRSRHGKFYPPYSPIPDYTLRELGYNF